MDRKRKTKQQSPGGQEANHVMSLVAMDDLKNGLLDTMKPSAPQLRVYCAQSVYLGTRITPVDFELYNNVPRTETKGLFVVQRARNSWMPDGLHVE